jgi:hypothetical protein
LIRRPFRGLALTASMAMAVGCALAEVAAPDSDDVLIVEAVLRAGAPRQTVLLHRSMEGRLVRGEPGARVEIQPPQGSSVVFQERPAAECLAGSPTEWEVEDLQLEASCYVSPEEAGAFVRPGQRYELLVRTRGGQVARGRTDVPGAFTFATPRVSLDPVTLSTRCALPTRAFRLAWTEANGTWAYIAHLRLSSWGDDLRAQGVDLPETLELTGVSVSAADTTMLFPASIGLFQRGDLDQRIFAALAQGLPDRANATLIVQAADRNYTNAIRGGNFNPSGNVRGSSVVGDAVGLFGSTVPLTIFSPSGEEAGLPPCPLAG